MEVTDVRTVLVKNHRTYLPAWFEFELALLAN